MGCKFHFNKMTIPSTEIGDVTTSPTPCSIVFGRRALIRSYEKNSFILMHTYVHKHIETYIIFYDKYEDDHTQTAITKAQ